MTTDIQNKPNNETPLESWKEIAAHLQRDVSTAMRWEKHEGLPVHRHHHLSRSSVYAYPSELDAWRAERKPVAEPVPFWRRPLPAVSFALALLLAVMTVGSGPYIGITAQAADGIVVRQVWRGQFQSEGAVSPDGRYLAFTDETWNLAVRDLTTGEIRRLTNNANGIVSPVFSPDGKRVAFGWYSQEFNECDLRVVEMEGSTPRVLYRAEKHEILPTDWSGDGKYILASRRRPDPQNDADIVSVAVADGSVTVLKSFSTKREPNRPFLFSADGRFVTYAFPVDQEAKINDIFALSVAGGQVTPLVQHPAQEQLLGWTPDGKSLLFLSDRTGNWAAWLVRVADGKPQGEPILAKRDTGAMLPMGFTREGSFYYKIRVDGLNVYTATLDGGEPSLLVERHLGWNFQPEWSPDGKRIAYLSRRQRGSADATLCIRSAETGEERVYSDKLRRVARWPLRWSPSGRSLLVRGQDVRGQRGLFTIDVGTIEVTHIAWWPPRSYGSYAVAPCWSADGKSLYYVEPSVATPEGRTRLVRTDLATGRHEVIHVFPESVRSGAVSLSPGGRWFLLWLGTPSVMRVGGTEIRELPGPWPADLRTLTWEPDSEHILFVKRSGTSSKGTTSELWEVPVEGGEQRSLGLSVMKDVVSLSVHPDGKRFAFTAWEPATEVWAMDNFLPPSEAVREARK